jgi:proteasome lid subunit RPN8/RPN11
MKKGGVRSTLNADLVRLFMQRSGWVAMMAELDRRGRGIRESGAFLLGSPATGYSSVKASEVKRIVYYDDLDAECLRGGIELRGAAFDKLWALCNESGLAVVADVHTHPTSSVSQSYIDRSNPMIACSGHLALIVPNFARGDIDVQAVGIYEYRGRHEWDDLGGSEFSIVHLDDAPVNRVSRLLKPIFCVAKSFASKIRIRNGMR